MEPNNEAARAIVGQRTRDVVRQLLEVLVPEDVLKDHPHLADTPRRVASWLLQYSQNGASVEDVLGPIFEEEYAGLVLMKEIEFTALCAHHLLPFHGKAAVGYMPRGRVLGLSKLARLVQHFSERVTLQEHITTSIVDALVEALEPHFAAVYLYDVEHGCVSARGVRQEHAVTNTYSSRIPLLRDFGHGQAQDAATLNEMYENVFWRTFGR